MIVNISGRTDIVHHYSDWLFRRFEQGYALSRNLLFPKHIRRAEYIKDFSEKVSVGELNLEKLGNLSDKDFPSHSRVTFTNPLQPFY